jgi:uncharacterized protein (DUF1015 family)
VVVPQLRPFSGLRYDRAIVPDLGAVLCPPYDVISADERRRLIERDPHNAVRLELPDSYEGATSLLVTWQDAGVLARDERPMLYVYEQRYALGGSERVARSFFCRLRLEDYGRGSGVQPHERTLAAPKEDRFRLLEATRVNLSPVLLLYDDERGGAASASLLDALTGAPPTASAAGPGGVGQRLWAIDPDATPAANELLDLAGRGPLTIADGHHRYETALRYRDSPGAAPDAEYVLALLYDAHSGGLSLRPWHRVVAGPLAAKSFEGRRTRDARDLIDQVQLAESDTTPGIFGVWTRDGGMLLEIATDRSPELDVDVLSSTLPQMIGATTDELNANGRLTYTSDARQAIAAVDSGDAEVAFLVRPTPVESVLQVAANGGFMPPKSTFFHPKAATGLVFNPLWS